MSQPYALRDARESDDAFIIDTWRRSFESDSEIFRFEPSFYFRWMARLIGRLIREPGARVRVLSDAADEDTLIGYAVYRGTELHYIYIRKDFRGQRLAAELLSEVKPETYSFRTDMGDRRLKPKAHNMVFTPRFIL